MEVDDEIRAAQEARKEGISLTSSTLDQDIYGGTGKKAYASSLPTEDEEREIHEQGGSSGRGSHPATRNAITAPKSLLDAGGDDGADPFKDYREQGGSGLVNTRIADREGEVSHFFFTKVNAPDIWKLAAVPPAASESSVVP